jgi:endonuclease/exonuclease/phosphatase family metal-dependent hydrolase
MGVRARWLRCLLVFICLGQTWVGAEVFRVATFNVENYLDTPSDRRPAKSEAGREGVRESILAMRPDILALQEIGSTNVVIELESALKAAGLDLPYSDYVAAHDTNIHLAVLSKFPIIARRPHTNDAFVLGGRRLEVSRGFEELELQINATFKLTLIAAHLKSRVPSKLADEEEWRYEEAVALRRAIEDRLTRNMEEKLIVLGDFNDLKDSKPVRTIMGRGAERLFDTRPSERTPDKQPTGITWTDYYAKEDLYSRIDYILLSPAMKPNWLPTETYVLNLTNWLSASDHRPVVAGFSTSEK